MSKTTFSKRDNYGLKITMFVVIIYTLLNSIYNLLMHGLLHFALRFAAGIFLIIIVRFIGMSKSINKKVESFLSPVLFVAIETAISVFLGSDRYYFFFLIACSVISLGYLERMGFILQALLVNAIVILLFAMNIPIMGSDYDMVHQIMFFLGYDLINILLYSICAFAVEKAKEQEKTSKTFNTIMDTTPSFMVVIDQNANIEYMSQSLAEWLHVSNVSYAINRPLLDLLPTIEMKIMFHEIIESRRFVERSFELLIDDKPCWFMLRSSKMSRSNINRFFEWSDITPIMDAKNAAVAQDNAKSDFLAKMSHEIRTPMNSIMGMSELILREDLSPGVYENTTGIKTASMNLLSLINDILDFSKIESGKLEIVKTDYLLTSLLNDVISVIRMRLLDQPILFVTNIDSRIPNALSGDEVRIRQILLNILSNAVKYTDSGFISLDVTGTVENQTVLLQIAVSDSGIGIKEEDLNKLFGEFVQMDMTKNHGIEGTGLGLAITHNLVRAMGGNIIVKSEYGKGSTFTVTLPQEIRQAETFAFVERAFEKQVLLYEPRDIYADSVKSSLENLGVSCHLVDSISHFHEALEGGTPYSFVFVPSFLHKEAKNAVKKNNSPAAIILLSNYGDLDLSNEFRTLAMPAHALSIANILNDIGQEYHYHSNKPDGIHFIAPTAKILIVDDIPTNLKVAEGLLLPYRMQIDTAKNGREAIDMITAGKDYDLVFMDHMMPEMDGLEATTLIRFTEGNYFKEVPIIALTANAVSGVKEMFIQNGMNDFLAKPIEMAKLNAILDKWIPTDKKERYTEAPTSQAAATFAIPGIDVAKGILMTGGDVDNYNATLSVFYMDGIHKISELQTCLQNADYSLFTTYVHALKSASASVGALEFSEAAKALEMAGRKEDVSFIEKNAPDLIFSLEVLLGNINKYMKTLSVSNHTEQISTEELRSKLLILRDALDNMDIGTADKILEEIQAKNLPEEAQVLMDSVSQDILIFEYEEANKNINEFLIRE